MATQSERREATEETFRRDIHGGMEFLSCIAFQVMDRNYDDDFDSKVMALVCEDADGNKKVKPVEGFRKQ